MAQLIISPLSKLYMPPIKRQDLFSKRFSKRPCAQNKRSARTGNLCKYRKQQKLISSAIVREYYYTQTEDPLLVKRKGNNREGNF